MTLPPARASNTPSSLGSGPLSLCSAAAAIGRRRGERVVVAGDDRELVSHAGQTEDSDDGRRAVDDAEPIHVLQVSFILTSRLIPVESMKVSSVRSITIISAGAVAERPVKSSFEIRDGREVEFAAWRDPPEPLGLIRIYRERIHDPPPFEAAMGHSPTRARCVAGGPDRGINNPRGPSVKTRGRSGHRQDPASRKVGTRLSTRAALTSPTRPGRAN